MKRAQRTKKINGIVYLTTNQAAKRLGVSKQTLLTYCKKGWVTNFLHGNTRNFLPEWLDEYLNEITKIGVYKEAKKL